MVAQCSSCGAKLTAVRPKPDGTVDCPRCGQALTLPADAETLASPPPAPDQNQTLTIGGPASGIGPDIGALHVPGYASLVEIGRGGMGVVYKAQQLNPPRLVALKMILAGEHADPEQLARFRAEAEAIARLTHPVIAQIHQVGEWLPPAGGPTVPFLTLEYVAGRPLSRRLGSGSPVTAPQAAALVRQLAVGVHYAHQQGIVHRDLKPGNILLHGAESSETLGEVKIVDFGLAKPLDGFASTVSEGPHTRTGAVLGTPSYMAPEQATGKGQIGPATDVYALGAVLYELLTGRPPFEGESTLETLLQVTKDEPEPPRRIRPKTPRDLETICLTCLAKSPERRYPSAAALGKDLGRFLAGEAVKVRPPSRRERLGRWARRHKEVVYLIGGAFAALVVVLVVALVRHNFEADTLAEVPKPPVPGPAFNDETPNSSSLSESRRRFVSQSNLKQIGVAFHNFHDSHGSLPPVAICDKAGKPLLSWRVAVLPFIEQDELYKQFKLDEPWNSEHNKTLIEKMPRMYANVSPTPVPVHTTHYQAVVGIGMAWEAETPLGGQFGRVGLNFNAFSDGLSNTILIVEAADPVIWSKPDDVKYDGKQLPKFGGVVSNGFNVAMGDGSVLFVRDTVKPADLRAALTRNGDERLPLKWEAPPTAVATGPGELSGRVTLNGKPIKGARIVLTEEGRRGAGLALPLLPDGTYSLTLPPGSYRVSFNAGEPPKNQPGEAELYRVPQQYSDPATSGITVQVRPGEQVKDFSLTDSRPKK